MGYVSTFIAVSEDCSATAGQIPPVSANGPSVAAVQYDVLVRQPYTLTQEDVLFESEVRRRWTPTELEPRRDGLRARFSEDRRPCLRSSPLTTKYGWGLHFDDEGRIALVAMESEEYARFVTGEVPGARLLPAMRSRRRA